MERISGILDAQPNRGMMLTTKASDWRPEVASASASCVLVPGRQEGSVAVPSMKHRLVPLDQEFLGSGVADNVSAV